jgi:hypothetical protein
VFSPLIIASNSSFRRILHNSFSFTGPYIFRSSFSYSIYLPKFFEVKVSTSLSFLLRNLNDQTARKQLYRTFCWR